MTQICKQLEEQGDTDHWMRAFPQFPSTGVLTAGLAEYAPLFQKHKIDGDEFLKLTPAKLTEIGRCVYYIRLACHLLLDMLLTIIGVLQEDAIDKIMRFKQHITKVRATFW